MCIASTLRILARVYARMRLLPYYLSLSSLVMVLAFPGRPVADEGRLFVPATAVGELAKKLIDGATTPNMRASPCRIYLLDRLAAVGTIIAAKAFADLRNAIFQELLQAQPANECQVYILDVHGEPAVDEFLAQASGGSVLSLSIFQSDDSVMILAQGYERDGGLAIHKSLIDVGLESSDERESGTIGDSGEPSSPAEAKAAPNVHRPLLDNREVEESPHPDGGEGSFLELLQQKKGTERAE